MPVQQLQSSTGGAVAPSDTKDIWEQFGIERRQSTTLYVGVGGNVRVLTAGGDVVTFKNIKDGQFMPVHVLKVFKTGTTASKIVALAMADNESEIYQQDLVLWQNMDALPYATVGSEQVMFFDGVDDSISITNATLSGTDITLSFWCMFTATSDIFFRIDTSSPTEFLRVITGGAVTGGSTLGASDFSTTISFSNVLFRKLYHMVFTLDAATGQLTHYRNGVLDTSGSFTGYTWGNITAYTLGQSGSSYGAHMIFSHSYHDTILSADEIASLYAAGINHDLSTAVGDYTSTSNLKGYWVNTGNTNADWVDLSGNGNNGTVNGNPELVYPIFENDVRIPDDSLTGNDGDIYSGYSFAFDGTNDSIDVGDTGASVKSISFYARPDVANKRIMQLQAAGAVEIYTDSSSLIQTTGITSPKIYVNGFIGNTLTNLQWSHVVVTTSTAVSADNVILGMSNSLYYDGQLTDIRFYDIELSQQQVADIYANPEKQVPVGASVSNVVAWWPFTDVAGKTAINAVSGGLGGAINGATITKSINDKVPQWGLKGNSQPMVFDGVDDYIRTGTGMAVPTEFTFNWWEQHNQTATAKTLLEWSLTSSSGRLWIHITNNNSLSVGDAVGIVSEKTLNNTCLPYQLNMVTVHLNITTNTVKIYINTELLVNITFSSTFPFSGTTSVYNIGIFSSSIHRFDGIIFNHGNWDSELSANEIASIYAAGINHDLRTTTGNYTSTANLKGYWVNTGNQNSDWLDLSGNGNNGTVNGSPVTTLLPEGLVAGKDLVGMDLKYPNNGAFMVPGSGYISVPDDNSLDLSTAFTIEFWLKLNKEAGSGFVIQKNLSYRVYVFATQTRIYLDLISSSTLTSLPSNINALTYDEWVHYAITYDNVNVKHYINAVLDRTLSYTSTIDNTSNALTTSVTSTQIDIGLLDSVKIYNVALTADQVFRNYKVELPSHS